MRAHHIVDAKLRIQPKVPLKDGYGISQTLILRGSNGTYRKCVIRRTTGEILSVAANALWAEFSGCSFELCQNDNCLRIGGARNNGGTVETDTQQESRENEIPFKEKGNGREKRNEAKRSRGGRPLMPCSVRSRENAWVQMPETGVMLLHHLKITGRTV